MITTKSKRKNSNNRFQYLVVIVFSFLIISSNNMALSQTLDSTAVGQYSFIEVNKNIIGNDSCLKTFYAKLANLKKTKQGVVTITQIGDSHIQADFFSGTMRQKLQLKYGNAGRGLIFPYHVAKSNEPQSYHTTTNGTWEAKRNVFYEKPLPIGISGFTIETAESKAELNLEVKDQPGLGYSFNRFILFHEKGFNSYDISVCDNTNCERARFTSVDSTSNPYISEMKLASPVNQIILKSISTDTGRMQRTRIYGMLLKNDSSGVLYNMIGVNGAEYRHYTLSEHFTQQLAYLNSDLIIVSMGTNEAFNKGFNKDVFYGQIDTLISKIKSTNPNACILLTTPGDSFRKSKKGRVKNPDVKLAEETIIKYCLSNNVAYWDLLEIMGGSGSMAKWNKAKLSSKDFVHFNPKGYQIQGNLLYEALMKNK